MITDKPQLFVEKILRINSGIRLQPVLLNQFFSDSLREFIKFFVRT